MTDVIVVDASVALKWVIDEGHSDQAHALLNDTLLYGQSVVAPPLLLSEATNGIYQQQRRGTVTAAVADQTLRAFLALPIHLSAPADLFASALVLARRYGLGATYDAQYLALAQTLDADLWTADEAFIKSLPRSLRRVRWVGDYHSL